MFYSLSSCSHLIFFHGNHEIIYFPLSMVLSEMPVNSGACGCCSLGYVRFPAQGKGVQVFDLLVDTVIFILLPLRHLVVETEESVYSSFCDFPLNIQSGKTSMNVAIYVHIIDEFAYCKHNCIE